MDSGHTKGGNTLLNREADRRDWLLAWILALTLHVAAILFVQKLPSPHAAPARKPEAIWVDLGATPAEARQPQQFTELPPDRKDKAPERPDLLSNVTSRARDRVPGGETNVPKMQGESDVPSVNLKSNASPPQAAAQQTEQDAFGKAEARAEGKGTGATSLIPIKNDLSYRGSAGNSDIDQPEMQNADGNASLLGDVSLNTIAWDYAPWLQRFGRRLLDRWYAPSAYMYGILKEGGYATIEVEFSKSGKMLRMDLLDQQGHPSLIQAAQNAMRSANPAEALPADFPEPTLILRVRMIYPKVRNR